MTCRTELNCILLSHGQIIETVLMVGTKLSCFFRFQLLWRMGCGVASQRSFWVNIESISWNLGSRMRANGKYSG